MSPLSTDNPATISSGCQLPVKKTLEGRPLPNSLDAEQGLLAACILDSTGEVIGRCMEQSISSDHFYDQSHQLIFDALLALFKENLEADEILLSDKLSDLGN